MNEVFSYRVCCPWPASRLIKISKDLQGDERWTERFGWVHSLRSSPIEETRFIEETKPSVKREREMQRAALHSNQKPLPTTMSIKAQDTQAREMAGREALLSTHTPRKNHRHLPAAGEPPSVFARLQTIFTAKKDPSSKTD